MTILRFFLKWGYRLVIGSIFCLLLLLAVIYILGKPPIPTTAPTVLLDSEGEVIPSSEAAPPSFTLEELAPHFVTAVVLTEDQHFYDHYGLDIPRIFRAIINNLAAQRLKEGASTITQQLARNLYLTHEKTLLRKLKEAFYTIRLEMFYSKEEILTAYLRTIYYGHGMYGSMQASHYFFDKDPARLTIAEAALLAGIPKGPTYYSPFNDEEKAKQRQAVILQLLWQQDAITRAEYEMAKNEPLKLANPKETTDTSTAYFRDLVFKEARDILQLSDQEQVTYGYTIETTLQQQIQLEATAQMKQLIAENNPLEVGLIVQKVNGAIISLIGGKDYEQSAFNRATEAKRLVGSTFKPLLYYAALEKGFTPATMLTSEPTTFKLKDGATYAPQNFNHFYANKPITLVQALALSDNIFAVKTQLLLQAEYVVDTARKFGIESDLPQVPSLSLGSASLSLLEMMNAYRLIANNGMQKDAYTIQKITAANGNVIYERKEKQGRQILDARKAFILADLMTGMFDRDLDGYMPVTGATIAPELTNKYAGKSGTTNTDNWMIGFSPAIVVGVWNGFDQNEAITNQNDRAIAKKLWAKTIEYAHTLEKQQEWIPPPGVTAVRIDPTTGMRATPDCPISKQVYFETSTIPKRSCSIHTPKKQLKLPTEEQREGYFKRLLKIFLSG